MTCAQLLLTLEGVPEDAPPGAAATGALAAATDAADAAFDSVSVQHPSAGVSAGGRSTQSHDRSDSGRLPLPSPNAAAPRVRPSAEDALWQPQRTGGELAGTASGVPHAAVPAGLTGTSPFSSDTRSRRSGSWSLSDAESMPTLPSSGTGMQPSPSAERIVALDNVAFAMRNSAGESVSSLASGDDVTISGVVRASSPYSTAPAHTWAMQPGLSSSAGRTSWAGSTTGARSQGLFISGDHSQYEDTSGLVGNHVLGGTVKGFLEGNGGRGVGEASEALGRGPAVEVMRADRMHACPTRRKVTQVRPSSHGRRPGWPWSASHAAVCRLVVTLLTQGMCRATVHVGRLVAAWGREMLWRRASRLTSMQPVPAIGSSCAAIRVDHRGRAPAWRAGYSARVGALRTVLGPWRPTSWPATAAAR